MAERDRGAKPISQGPGTYTAPLGLMARLSRPDTRIDLVPLLDLVAIALLVALMFTRFVALPGVSVDLPRTGLRTHHTAPDVAILTVGNSGALYFDGGIFERNTIAAALRAFLEEAPDRDTVLLIKAQSRIDLQLFLEICEMAQTAGFPQVQIIGERADPVGPILPGEDPGALETVDF